MFEFADELRAAWSGGDVGNGGLGTHIGAGGVAGRALGLAVARIKSVTPLTWEDYRQGIEQALSRDLQQEIVASSTDSPFSFPAAAARHGWVIRVHEDEEPDTTSHSGQAAPADRG